MEVVHPPDLPTWLGWMLSERPRQWCRSFLLGQPDLTFPDHIIQPVKLAPEPVLRSPVNQGCKRTTTNGPRGISRSRPSEGATPACPALKRW
jgi:hypothetical protein